MEIVFGTPVDAREFRTLPGVREANAVDCRLTIAFEGSPDAVVKAASTHEVRAIRTHEDDLEEIFLRYYGSGSG